VLQLSAISPLRQLTSSSCTSAHVPRNAGGVQMLLLCGEVATTDLDEDDGNEGEGEDFDFSFHQTDAITLTQAHMIDPNWILLDTSGSTAVSIFSNKKFLKNIRHCGNSHGLRIPHSNGGHQDTHMIGDMPGFGPVWYNAGSLAKSTSSLSPSSQRYAASPWTRSRKPP
jgi:hypothetical protein